MTDKSELTQADREAADAWRRDWMHCQGEHTQLVQAFARHRIAHTRSQPSDSVVEAVDAIQEIIDRYAIAGANLLQWITPEDEKSMPRPRQRVAGLPIFPPSTTEWRDWASDVACRAAFQALREAKDAVKALAAQPCDDVRFKFGKAVWDALKADTNDLRKQQRIVKAFDAALRLASGEGV